MHLAAGVSRMTVSAIKEMAMRSAKVAGTASLTWGLPSFPTPEPIRRAVAEAFREDPDIGKYSLPDGLPELRRLVAQTHQRATGVTVDSDEQVLITAGNMQGLNALFHTLLDPGDEIIVTDPGFASHIQQIRLCGGVPVYWTLDADNGWALDPETLSDKITRRTRAIVLVTPSNPTGRIFAEDALRRTMEIARAHDLMVLLDDPYSHFVFENGSRYFNPASVPDWADSIAYLFTFSKAYAMSGWRLGYMVVPPALKREVIKVHDATLICAPRVSQAAGIAALAGDAAHLEEFSAVLARRRDLICERLDAVPHVFDYARPEGAYYVFPRIRVEHDSDTQFALDLLYEAKVAVPPGSAFGPSGSGHVRMAYCVEDDVIERAFDRIEKQFPA